MDKLIKLNSAEDIKKDAEKRLTSHGYHAMLGLRLISWEEKRVEIGLTVQAKHLNLGGVIHGGVLSSLLDIACAQAGTFCPYGNRIRKSITLSLATTLLDSVTKAKYE